MNNQQNPTLKANMLAALEKTLGVVSTAAKIAGIDRCTHYEWLKEDSEYAEKVAELKNVALDFAETKLHAAIDGMDTNAIKFFLKTQGKQRGYIEQNEVNVTGLEEIIKRLSNTEIE
mgnify:FL=1